VCDQGAIEVGLKQVEASKKTRNEIDVNQNGNLTKKKRSALIFSKFSDL
jgi:hypothetical protein